MQEARMADRLPALRFGAVLLGSIALLEMPGHAQPPVAAATIWTTPRTPDGQPDLQGAWLSKSATPLERPKALEGRALLTDQEVAQLQERAHRMFKDGN